MKLDRATQEHRRIATTHACLQANQWGWNWKHETDGMVWVDTGENEIGCTDMWDFVGLVNEEIKRRAIKR